MKLRLGCVALAFLSVVLSLTAQTTSSQPVAATSQVPRLVKFSGTLERVSSDHAGNGVVLGAGEAPTRVVGITFSLYAEQAGGAALWSEVQNVRVDAAGRYTVCPEGRGCRDLRRLAALGVHLGSRIGREFDSHGGRWFSEWEQFAPPKQN